ncbi:hypothetical protein AL755_13170 [Arthrobacter sp. ERGS1:01]|uniref:hypothetical protein n=1 Tax=Arthrobacter sp. ERGS1:01 TaxID=1704044 RepID=UPI0006CB4395|nr:hypothetical protein [Arthrobacter sp. ERGS1:01]ALE06191.1 hypothetical protein AL755_13170 [Arthrobacter sp. ERGS1:01]
MNIDHTTPASAAAPGRRWRKRTAAGAAGALLLGAGIFGGTAAFASGPSPTASTSAPAAGAHATAGTQGLKTAAKNHAKSPEVHLLRKELRIDIQAKTGYGDRAHVVAFALIHRPAAFAKLPTQLKTDLSTLEAAPAASRDADAALIKSTALSGGYGATIQKEAQAITAKLASVPATTAP